MNVDFVCLKKLSPAKQAHCIREGLSEVSDAERKGIMQTIATPLEPKELWEEPSTPSRPEPPIDTYIQILATKGRTPEDILQTLEICYEDSKEDIAVTTTFSSDEDF